MREALKFGVIFVALNVAYFMGERVGEKRLFHHIAELAAEVIAETCPSVDAAQQPSMVQPKGKWL